MNIIHGTLIYDNDHEKRMAACAYQCFFVDKYGKEWLDSYRIDLLAHKDFIRSTFSATELAYSAGRDDAIRDIIQQVDSYKMYLEQGITKHE